MSTESSAPKAPWPNRLWIWLSICSAHQYGLPGEGCDRCDAGHYFFVPTMLLSSLFFKLSPPLWRLWRNKRWVG